MSKRWFTPSFGASSEESPPSKRKPKSKSNTRKTTRGFQPIRIQSKVGVDLLNKYEPQTPEDLVIHYKKVEEVQSWLRDQITDKFRKSKYVLLHGPTGCGKSTTLRVLAKSMNVKLIEWITPLDRDWYRNEDDNNSDFVAPSDLNFGYQSGSDSFDNFLLRASRYGSLTGELTSKIILIKDFPNSFVQNPSSFHDVLEKYSHIIVYPVAFICNDDAACRSLFPQQIRDKFHIHDISFNAVNCTAVTKALKRVMDIERQTNSAVSIPSDINLQSFHEQSSGDLRCALLKFYVTIIKPTSTVGKSVKTTFTSKQIQDMDRDHNSLDVFKLLGRVLYSKRETVATQTDDIKFVYDPDQIIKAVSSQPSNFMSFLQENYISRFTDIKSISSVVDSFCIADNMMKHRYKDDLDNLALNCVVRNLMVSNNKPKRSFSPFAKPKFYDNTETLAKQFSTSIRNSFPQFQLSSSELVMYVLPLVRANPSHIFHQYVPNRDSVL